MGQVGLCCCGSRVWGLVFCCSSRSSLRSSLRSVLVGACARRVGRGVRTKFAAMMARRPRTSRAPALPLAPHASSERDAREECACRRLRGTGVPAVHLGRPHPQARDPRRLREETGVTTRGRDQRRERSDDAQTTQNTHDAARGSARLRRGDGARGRMTPPARVPACSREDDGDEVGWVGEKEEVLTHALVPLARCPWCAVRRSPIRHAARGGAAREGARRGREGGEGEEEEGAKEGAGAGARGRRRFAK